MEEAQAQGKAKAPIFYTERGLETGLFPLYRGISNSSFFSMRQDFNCFYPSFGPPILNCICLGVPNFLSHVVWNWIYELESGYYRDSIEKKWSILSFYFTIKYFCNAQNTPWLIDSLNQSAFDLKLKRIE